MLHYKKAFVLVIWCAVNPTSQFRISWGKKFLCSKCFSFQSSLFLLYRRRRKRSRRRDTLVFSFTSLCTLYLFIQPNPSQPSNVTYVSLSIPDLQVWTALDNAELQERFKDWWPNLLTPISQRDNSIISLLLSVSASAPACSTLQLVALVPCSLFPLCLLFLHLNSPRCSTHVSYRLFINILFRANVLISFCAVGLLSLHYCFLLVLLKGHVTLKADVIEYKEQLAKPVGVKTIQLPELLVFIRKGKGSSFWEGSKE